MPRAQLRLVQERGCRGMVAPVGDSHQALKLADHTWSLVAQFATSPHVDPASDKIQELDLVPSAL
jgi:hypothetical protein